MSEVIRISASATDLLPVSVKLLSGAREETIHALRKSGDEISPLRVARVDVERLGGELYAVGGDKFDNTFLCRFSSQALSSIASRQSGSPRLRA